MTPTAQATTTSGQAEPEACRLGELEARDYVSARCAFYRVHGSTLASLARQLDRGVRDPRDGTWNAASTTWHVRWSYGYIAATGCKVSAPAVRLTVRYTLPRWEPPRRVDPAVVTAWNRFLQELWEHERGHTRNGLAAAREIRSMLAESPDAPSCRRLESKVDAEGERILDRRRREDLAYDEATDHGRTTGAVLIP